MSPDPSPTGLKAHGNERDHVLARIVHALGDDSRVVAAWLTGSFAAGTTDEWSDVDLCAVIRDEDFAAFVEHRAEFHDRVGEVVGAQSIDADRNFENPGSQFDLLIYRNGVEVDLTLMPQRLALRPDWTRLLFDRIDVAVDNAAAETEDERCAYLQAQLDFFWAMVAVGLKEVGRGYTTGAAASVERLTNAFDILWRRIHHPGEPRPESRAWRHRPAIPELTAITPRLGKEIDPIKVLDVIRQLSTAVERLHPLLSKQNLTISEQMPGEMASLSELALAALLV